MKFPFRTSSSMAAFSLSLMLAACPTSSTDKADAGSSADASEDGGEEAIPVDMNNTESLYMAAQQEFIAGNFQQAAEYYQTILLREKSARAWHALGDVHMALMQFNNAAKNYEKALALEPDKRMSMMRLARALQRSGEFLRAVEVYRQAQAKDLTDPEAFRLEAEALEPLGRLDEAIDRMETSVALEKDPAKQAETLQAMSVLAQKLDKHAEAIGYLERAVKLNPTAELYSALAEAALKTGDFAKTRDAYREAANIDHKDPFYWEVVGELELRLGNKEAARQAFEASIRIKPAAPLYIGLGRLDLAEGKADAAKEMLNKALELTEGEARDVRESAHLAASLKDFALAEKLLLTLTSGEDTEDQEALWLEISAIRSLRQDSREDTEAACRQARFALLDTLNFDNRLFLLLRNELRTLVGKPVPEDLSQIQIMQSSDSCQTLLKKAKDSQLNKVVLEEAAVVCARAIWLKESLPDETKKPEQVPPVPIPAPVSAPAPAKDDATDAGTSPDGGVVLPGMTAPAPTVLPESLQELEKKKLPEFRKCPPDSVPWTK